MIVNYRQEQLRDYLTQILGFPNRNGVSKVNQGTMATLLSVSQAGISIFLKKDQNSIKLLRNFKAKYATEFSKWPQGKKTIGRVLVVADVRYFLNPTVKVVVPKPIIVKREVIKTEKDKDVKSPTKVAKRSVEKEAIKVDKASRPRKLGKAQFDELEPTRKPLILKTKPSKKSTALKVAKATRVTPAPIAISYRGHQSLNDGKGMLFDHMRVQDLTKFPTCTFVPKDSKVAAKAEKYFKEALKDHSASLFFGKKNGDISKYPPNVQGCADFGLLIIPGRVHKIENEPIRLAHEYEIIRGALNRGQPILGICAGTWRLYEQLYVWTKMPSQLNKSPEKLSAWHIDKETLIDVKDHNCNNGMIRLDVNGVQASYNVQIHDILIRKASLLKAAMKGNTYLKGDGVYKKNVDSTQTVNSVHWKAVNEDRLPKNVVVSAEAMQCPDIEIKARTGLQMKPQEEIAEAFENVFGAPVMGIQWHPEGYNIKSSHANVIKYMAEAGSAYAAKRKMLKELLDKSTIDIDEAIDSLSSSS